MIELLAAWHDEHAAELERRHVSVSLTRSSAVADKAAAWLDFESPRTVAQLILWETGEMDVRVGSRGPGDFDVDAHYEGSSPGEVRAALGGILARM